jgi:hypothetical protein
MEIDLAFEGAAKGDESPAAAPRLIWFSAR